MYVSSEVRRREIPDSTPEPMYYPTSSGGASFMDILAEVARTNDDFSDHDVDRTGDVATEAQDDTVDTDMDAPPGETTETATAETETTEGEAMEAPPTEPAGVAVTPPPAPITVAATDTDGAAVDAEKAVAVPITPHARTLIEVAPTTELEATAPPAEPIATPEVSTENDLTNAVEGAVDHTLTAELSMDADVEPAPPAMLFPKTLKSILAEGAVRPIAESVVPETAMSASESTAPPPETTSQEATELPESTPLPHAAAMESAGVRPQSATVSRLPMANLPGELAQQIHLMQQEGTRTMRLRLVPENLGELQIEIQGTGDAMKVRLVSANPVVRDALESQMGDLKDAMQKQGLALDQATVDGEPNRRDLPQEQEQRRATTSYRDTPTSPDQPEIRLRPSAPAAVGPGALNVLA